MKARLKRIWKWIWTRSLLVMGLSVLWVVVYKFIDPPVTPLMVIRYFQMPADTRTLQYDWKDLDTIGMTAPLALVASEDQLFPSHSGFDVAAIQKAITNNLSEDRKQVRGASTISQQTAKNVFLWPSRSWLRKGLEVWFTFWIELIWGKERILEVYCNVVETGPGIYGLEASAQHFFKRPAEKLTREQAALIAVVLPNPRSYSVANPSAYLRKRQQWVLKQMWNLGPRHLDAIRQ